MKKIITTFFLGLLSTAFVPAQIIEDVALFNAQPLRGSARYLAMGGAFTALGNDYSALHLNPAGISVFKENQLGLSLGFGTLTMNNRFYNNSTNASLTTVNIENFGLNFKIKNSSGNRDWSHFGFGISYQKLAEFDRQYTVRGFNDERSLSQMWAANVNGLNADVFFGTPEYAAWQSFLLVSDTNDVVIPEGYAHALDSDNDIAYTRDESGGLNELALQFGGQYRSNFYYGVSIGFPSLNYFSEEVIRESGFATETDPVFSANRYNYRRTNRIDADGINLKVGIIGRPVNWLRVGLSYESPSWYLVNQSTSFDVTTSFDDGETVASDIFSSGDYAYRLSTPSIFRGGLAFIFGKRGLLSVDYSLQDARNNRLSVNSQSFNINASDLVPFNDDIDNLFTDRQTLAVGGELNLGPVVLRAGYQNLSSAFENESLISGDAQTYSGGLALRLEKIDLELSFAQSEFDRTDNLYTNADGTGLRPNRSDNRLRQVNLGFNYRF